jgi:hypothetical protein
MVCTLLLASPVQGMVYMWRDSVGIAHYTNKEYEIPARYKTKAKALYPEATDSGSNQRNSPNEQINAVVPPSPVSGQQANPVASPEGQASVTVPQQQNSAPVPSSRRGKRHRARTVDE